MKRAFLPIRSFNISSILPGLLFCIGISAAHAQSWESTASGTTQHLNGVFITSDGTGAVAVGNGGTVLSFDGTSWSPVPGAPDIDFIDVHGTRTDYFVAGGIDQAWHCSNGVWNILATNAPGEYAFTPVHVSADESNIWYQQFKVSSGGFPFHFLFTTGSEWGVANQNPIMAFAQDGSDVRYVDRRGTIERSDAELFTTNLYDNSAAPLYSLNAAWFVPDNLDEVFAIRNESEVYHFDGLSWSSMNAGLTERLIWLGGTSSTNVYVVGVNTTTGDGVMHHFDGTQWSAETLPSGFKGLIDIAFLPPSPAAGASLLRQGNNTTFAGIAVGELGKIAIQRKFLIVYVAVQIISHHIVGDTMQLFLGALQPGYTYRVQSAQNLIDAIWVDALTGIASTGESVIVYLTLLDTVNQFFRVIAVPDSP